MTHNSSRISVYITCCFVSNFSYEVDIVILQFIKLLSKEISCVVITQGQSSSISQKNSNFAFDMISVN